MAKEIGKVADIKDDWIDVRIPTGSGCTFCHSKTSCSFHGPDSAYHHMKIRYRSGIDIGDKIILEMPESAQNISALVVFGLPVILILAGIGLAKYYFQISNGELWGVLSGVILYGIALTAFNRWLSRLPMFSPRIISVEKSNTEKNPKTQKIDPVIITKMHKLKN